MNEIASPKPSEFVTLGKDNTIKFKFNYKYNELLKRISNWETVFDLLTCKFSRCKGIFYGDKSIQNMINTKTELYNPVIKSIVDELLSFLKSNPRSITVDVPNYSEYKDIINDVIGSVMIKGDVYNKFISAFKDYLIYGISFVKIDTKEDSMIQVDNVDVSSCIWDINTCYKSFKPSFFIREYVVNNFDASNKYGEEYVRIRHIDNKVKFHRINKDSNAILENVNNICMSDEQITVEYGDDIFSDASKVVTKEEVDDGMSQVIEYYVLENLKSELTGKVNKCYSRYIFVNGQMVKNSTKHNIPVDSFPYISMSSYIHDNVCASRMFNSKVGDTTAEIIQFNIIENSKCDAILASANGALIINKKAISNKSSRMNKIKSNVIILDNVNTERVSDSIVNVPPATIDQAMMAESTVLLTRMRKKFGLLDFDPNASSVKSGYHESLRLDRESQSINNIITPLDYALNNVGKILVNVIKEFSKKGIDTLLKLTKNPKAEELFTDLAKINSEFHIDVSESRESPNNSMKKMNQLSILADITGAPINIPYDIIAKSLNFDEEIVNMLQEFNVAQEDELRNAEIQDKLASAQDKKASATKKLSEIVR